MILHSPASKDRPEAGITDTDGRGKSKSSHSDKSSKIVGAKRNVFDARL
jgi:hypothetical protein